MIKKRKRAAGMMLMIGLAAGCSLTGPEKEADRTGRGEGGFRCAPPAREEQAGKSLPTALEQFGAYMGELLTQGRWAERNRHVISRPIEWEEAADMAGLDPAFEHFALYGEHRANSEGMLMAEADVDGDGIGDIIEYQFKAGKDRIHVCRQNSLAIYAGRPEGGYEVMYSRPYLDTDVPYLGRMLAAEYNGAVFLIFEENYLRDGTNDVDVYQVDGGGLSGRLRIHYENTGMDAETAYCRRGMEEKAQELCMKAEEYWKTLRRFPDSIAGDAEEALEEGTEDYIRLERIDEERWEHYRAGYGEDDRGNEYMFTTILNRSKPEAHQSDIDNDGETEAYAKRNDLLGRTGYYRTNEIYKTGELYGNGRHEGRWGLDYVMEDGGEGTDFEKLCGLDVWQGEYTPQAFWVDRCGEENITFMAYADREYMGMRIEGYCIRNGGYERVLCVEYRPRIKCTLRHDRRKGNQDGGVLSYAVNMVPRGEREYPRIYGMEDEGLQEEINGRLKEKLEEKTDAFFDERPYIIDCGSWCNVESASEKFLVLMYDIVYEYEDWDRTWGEEIYVGINLENGEIEFYEKYKNEMQPGW